MIASPRLVGGQLDDVMTRMRSEWAERRSRRWSIPTARPYLARTFRERLKAGLVDSLHLHMAPVVLGAGTKLFDGLSDPIELERTEVVESQFGTHLRFRVVK